jgi:hypothetical protein
VIASLLADRGQRATALALYGKMVTDSLQVGAFAGRSGEEARSAALARPELEEALKWYLDAFGQDLNRPQSGSPRWASFCVRNELAQCLPATWAERFDSDDDAARALAASDASSRSLRARCSSRSSLAATALSRQPILDVEAVARMELFEADFALLTSARPRPRREIPRRARRPAAVVLSTVHEQLAVFWQLGVRSDFAAASLAAVAELIAAKPAVARAVEPPQRVLLFTGHMIDEPVPSEAALSRDQGGGGQGARDAAPGDRRRAGAHHGQDRRCRRGAAAGKCSFTRSARTSAFPRGFTLRCPASATA